LEIAERIGCGQFMMIDGDRLLPLYNYALRRRVGITCLRKARDRIQSIRQEQKQAVRHMPLRSEAQELHLQAFALGPSRVMKDGRLLERSDWGSAVTKEMFFYLLEQRQPLLKEQIIDLFWPEVSEERANSNFHSTTYRLRQAIAPNALLYENELYRLNPDLEFWYDVEVFQDLLARANQQGLPLEQQERVLEEAIGIYGGNFMAECYSDWCIPQREALGEIYLKALLQLGQIRALRNDLDEAIELFESALKLDNLREETYTLLMRMYALKGDRNGVTRWYRRCQEVLKKELGVHPLPETTQLYQELTGRA
jgi:DNA-binding SARP family transcriptional activator